MGKSGKSDADRQVLIGKVCNLIRIGASIHSACLATGLDNAEIEALANDDEFLQAAAQAEAQCEAILLKRIADDGGWQGARFILERKLRLAAMADGSASAAAAAGNAKQPVKVRRIEYYDPDVEG